MYRTWSSNSKPGDSIRPLSQAGPEPIGVLACSDAVPVYVRNSSGCDRQVTCSRPRGSRARGIDPGEWVTPRGAQGNT
jgi:hypothetical protein